MKREKYFRDELQRLFFGYAVVPAVLFTLVCGILFMAALIHGRKSSNLEQNRYVAGKLEQVISGYEEALKELSRIPGLAAGPVDEEKRAQVFECVYRAAGRMGYEADFYILDKERELYLTNSRILPDYLDIKDDISWGIFQSMESHPGETAVRLMNGWKNQEGSIVLGRSLVSDRGQEGYVLFSIGSGRFLNAMDQQDAQTIIVDRFGWVFFNSSYIFLTDSNQIRPVLKQAGSYLTYDGKMYLADRQAVCGGMFEVYSVSDIQNIVVSLTICSALVVTALALMTVWVFVSSRVVTEKKTADLYRILEVMGQVREGQLDSVIHIDSDNEFKIIAEAWNETIDSLKRQMENNRRMTELVAISQNKQLESQFNPHFLYNTLENIRYMCKLEPATAERMVYSLSNLLRYSLDGSKDQVPLREDLDHLKNYLTILERRFGSRFEYRIDVEEEALDCRIPKLVLQPMIENAVKYGFGNQLNLKTELKAYIHEGTLTMICRDDGVGMSQTVLSEITNLLEQKENTSRHSGLYNIHRRITLLYGRPYGVEVRSMEGHGTTLVVTVPVRRAGA